MIVESYEFIWLRIVFLFYHSSILIVGFEKKPMSYSYYSKLLKGTSEQYV